MLVSPFLSLSLTISSSGALCNCAILQDAQNEFTALWGLAGQLASLEESRRTERPPSWCWSSTVDCLIRCGQLQGQTVASVKSGPDDFKKPRIGEPRIAALLASAEPVWPIVLHERVLVLCSHCSLPVPHCHTITASHTDLAFCLAYVGPHHKGGFHCRDGLCFALLCFALLCAA